MYKKNLLEKPSYIYIFVDVDVEPKTILFTYFYFLLLIKETPIPTKWYILSVSNFKTPQLSPIKIIKKSGNSKILASSETHSKIR
jgi:hypothetical protein